MAPTAHSEFPASSAHRLLACPGSFEASKPFVHGPRRATIYSAEGTLAHSLSEAALLSGADPAQWIGRKLAADTFEFDVDEDLVQGVQAYIDVVQGLRALGYHIVLETRVSPAVQWAGIRPDLPIELFGTSDCIAYHPDDAVLAIVDLKFGRGVPVSVKDNDQLLYYAAGAMNPELVQQIICQHEPDATLPKDWQPSKVLTIVVQPRAWHPDGPVRQAVYTPQQVRDWALNRLYPGVEAAIMDGGKTLVVGEHCRFCPVLAHCIERRRHMQETARRAFLAAPAENIPMPDLLADEASETNATRPDDAGLAALPETHLSDEALGELMDKIAILKPYLAAVEALAEERSRQQPGCIPGWKLVPTRARRVWAEDDQTVIAGLTSAGLDPATFTETVLRSPAQVERRLGKKRYRELAEPFVVSASSGTKLAPEGDPRARYVGRTAQEAFGILPGLNQPTNEV